MLALVTLLIVNGAVLGLAVLPLKGMVSSSEARATEYEPIRRRRCRSCVWRIPHTIAAIAR